MMGYFKPLRRKIGVVTLVLTCVLTSCWHPYMQLRAFASFIDTEYAAPLDALKAAIGNAKDTLESPYYLSTQIIQDEYRAKFEQDVFYSVGIFFGAPNRNRSIKAISANDVVSLFSFFSTSNSARNYIVTYAESSAGQRLLRYRAFLSEPANLRWIDVLFSRDAIESQMKSRQQTRPSVDLIYWPIVVSLASLSAWLLLSNPRAKVPKTSTEPQV